MAPLTALPPTPTFAAPTTSPRPPRRALWTTRLAVVGTTFRKVGLGRLGALVLAETNAAERVELREALEAEELVCLATCNRVEYYALLRRPRDADALVATLAAFYARRGVALDPEVLAARTGDAAVEHLLNVSSAIDSLIVGEGDISRQVRRAVEADGASGLCGPRLRLLFERAALCARRVRAATGLGRTGRSVAMLALARAQAYLGPEGPGRTVLVGTGETIRRVARGLAHLPGERLFVGRSLDKAEALATELGGRALTLEQLLLEPPPWIDLLVTATAATETVVPAWALSRALAARAHALCRRPLVICDLGVPRDVDPALDRVPGVQVISIESLEAEQRACGGVSDEDLVGARRIARAETERLLREERFQRLADEGTRALLDDALHHLSPHDRELLVRFTVGLAGRLARQPQEADLAATPRPWPARGRTTDGGGAR